MIANNPQFWRMLKRYNAWVRSGGWCRAALCHLLPAHLPVLASVWHVLAFHAEWMRQGAFPCTLQSLAFLSLGWFWTTILLCLMDYPWGGGGGGHRYDLSDDPLPGLGYTPPSPVEVEDRDLVH